MLIIIKSILLIFILNILKIQNVVESAKILTVFPQGSRSHYIACEVILKELARRGHEVTSISYFPQKEPLKNFRDIALEMPESYTSNY